MKVPNPTRTFLTDAETVSVLDGFRPDVTEEQSPDFRSVKAPHQCHRGSLILVGNLRMRLSPMRAAGHGGGSHVVSQRPPASRCRQNHNINELCQESCRFFMIYCKVFPLCSMLMWNVTLFFSLTLQQLWCHFRHLALQLCVYFYRKSSNSLVVFVNRGRSSVCPVRGFESYCD